MKKNRCPLVLVYFISLLFMEFIFRIFAVGTLFSFSWIYIVILIIFLSFLFTLFSSLGHRKTNQKVTSFFLFIIAIWYCAEVIFKRTFQVYFSVSTCFFADQAVSFLDKVLEIIITNVIPVMLLFLPFILSIVFHKRILYWQRSKEMFISLFFFMLIALFFFMSSLYLFKNDENSPYKLFFELNNNALNKETFGALPSVFIEINKMIIPSNPILYENKENIMDEPKIYEKNILDIDFEDLVQKEGNNVLKNMHQFFANEEATYQNEYTGFFKNKNLILFMAESFNSIAVSEDLTPTLYKLTHEGFVFENFYSPVILSTIGGEFQELTGLYPNLSMLSNVWRNGKNLYPFGLGNRFQSLKYDTFAYHNHRYNFQNRDVYLKSIGLSNYLGCNNGLEKRINCLNWPESDLEMIESTVSDYLDKEHFFTYYVTVSGHMSYNFTSNDMAIKHKEEVKDLSYSSDIKAYLAANIELDKALEKLIQELSLKGKLDNTVIALVGDHYPYDISLDHINEIANPKRDDTIEINRSNFLLWNSKMDTVSVSKVGGNMDVLPTLLNLFDIPYDSRLIMGRDLFSTSDGLVIFNDSSWVTNEGIYYASTNNFIPKIAEKDYNGYVERMNKIVSNRINLSKMILETDYYRKVLGD